MIKIEIGSMTNFCKINYQNLVTMTIEIGHANNLW